VQKRVEIVKNERRKRERGREKPVSKKDTVHARQLGHNIVVVYSAYLPLIHLSK
jgi:hypothetical protein